MANEFIIRKGYKSLSDSQITGSLSVSNAVTASFFTGSFRGDGSELTGIDGFPFTGSAAISGSLTVVGPVNAITFTGDGSQLTGIEGFPFTGSARITGSLVVVGPVTATSFIGSLQGTATTASYVLNAVSSSFATTASYVNIANVDGFTAYSSSVNTAIGSVLNATTPLTATVNTTNTPFTITSQSIVIVDSTNGNVTVNLPNLNTVVGTPNQKPIVVYKNDYSQNVIFVSPSGSQLINGASQDVIVSIQLAVIYNPTSAGWVTEGTSAQSLAELELFFVPRTETGSLSVATASYVQYTNVVNKPTLVSGSSQISFSGITNKPTLVSGSSQISFTGITNKPTLVSGSSQITYSGIVNKPTGIVSSSVQVKEYNVFATTGSNQFNGNQSISGSLTVSGQVVAQTLNVQQVTSSIVYSSGSNIFGNNSGNTHRFTGSLGVTGSLSVSGTGTFNNSIYGTNALFGSAFLSNETSKIGIGFESGYGLVNSWGANTSTFGGLKFQINASNGNTFNALTIAPSGFVGIGTNASLPYGRFEVADVSQLTNAGQWASATISMKQVSGVIGNYSQIVFGYHSNTQTNGSAYIGYVATNQGTNGYGDLVFGTRAVNTDTQPTERMRITSGGSVGIGIDNPSTFLHVFGSNTANRGQLSIQSNNASNGARATWYYDTTLQGEIGTTSGDFYALAVNNFLFYTGGNPRMTITSGGNVGIGTTSPNLSAGAAGSTILTISATTSGRNGVLELNGTRTNSTDISGYVRFFNNGAATPLADIRGIRGSSDTVGDLAFETSNSERMRITSGGSVGINNTSPMNSAWGNDTNTKQLSIDGSSYAVINLQGSTRKYSMGVGDNNFYMCYDNTANRHNIVVSSGGNVLLGTSTDSGSKLRVIGNLQIDGFQKMYTYYIIVQPNTTGTITISSPTGTNMQGSMQVIAGGSGNSLSGNVTGLWMVGGLLFFNNASTSTITQIVNSVTADGSMSFQRSSDQYTVSLANTSSTQTKTFYVSVIINGD